MPRGKHVPFALQLTSEVVRECSPALRLHLRLLRCGGERRPRHREWLHSLEGLRPALCGQSLPPAAAESCCPSTFPPRSLPAPLSAMALSGTCGSSRRLSGVFSLHLCPLLVCRRTY